MSKRKMDIDDKKKAFMLGVLFMMVYIIIYFAFVHKSLGGDMAPWQLVDGILLTGIIGSFVSSFLIVKLRMGETHSEERTGKKHFED